MILFVSNNHTGSLEVNPNSITVEYAIAALTFTSTFEINWEIMNESEKDEFENSFKVATATEMNVPIENVVIHEITAGSAVVDSSIYLQEGSAVTIDPIKTKLLNSSIIVTYKGDPVGSSVSTESIKTGFVSIMGETAKTLAEPHKLTARNFSADSLELIWTDEDNGDATVLKYLIYKNNILIGEVSGEVFSYTVVGLEQNIQYTFIVRKRTQLENVDSIVGVRFDTHRTITTIYRPNSEEKISETTVDRDETTGNTTSTVLNYDRQTMTTVVKTTTTDTTTSVTTEYSDLSTTVIDNYLTNQTKVITGLSDRVVNRKTGAEVSSNGDLSELPFPQITARNIYAHESDILMTFKWTPGVHDNTVSQTYSIEYSSDLVNWAEYDSFEYRIDDAETVSVIDKGLVEYRRTEKLVSPVYDTQAIWVPNIRLKGLVANTNYYVRLKKVDGTSIYYSPIESIGQTLANTDLPGSVVIELSEILGNKSRHFIS